MDSLRIYVLFDPAFQAQGDAWTHWLSQHLGCLGMQRDECRFGIPVQSRSTPWGSEQPGLPGTQHPRRIDLGDARRNCILLLVDHSMASFTAARWDLYVADVRRQMAARGERDLLIPVFIGGASSSLADLPQAMRNVDADLPSQPEAGVRFLLKMLNSLLVHRQPPHSRDAYRAGQGIFVSHAKRDGWQTAERVAQALTRVGEGSRPALFLDTDSLLPGSDYEQRFRDAIGSGSLLAIVTDAYHTRPWCRWELLTAKRLGRPIVVADLCRGRIERTSPYFGNAPSQRIDVDSGESAIPGAVIEKLTLALLSETLRFELWQEHAQARLNGKACRLLARPPELVDLAAQGQRASAAGESVEWIIYPDPPLGREETDLLSSAFPHQPIFSLSQALARQ